MLKKTSHYVCNLFPKHKKNVKTFLTFLDVCKEKVSCLILEFLDWLAVSFSPHRLSYGSLTYCTVGGLLISNPYLGQTLFRFGLLLIMKNCQHCTDRVNNIKQFSIQPPLTCYKAGRANNDFNK